MPAGTSLHSCAARAYPVSSPSTFCATAAGTCAPIPLEERKHRLADLVEAVADSALQRTDGIAGEGKALFALVEARGMEGVVAKRLGSPYAPGRRTGAWVKVKVPGYAPDRREWFERRSEVAHGQS